MRYTFVVRPERLYAGYFAAQAAAGVAFWALLAGSDQVRSWFDLLPEHPAVVDAFVLADAGVVVASVLAARSLWREGRFSVALASFAAGGMVYATLVLVVWVALTDTGAATLAIMVPPTILNCWIAAVLVAGSARRPR